MGLSSSSFPRTSFGISCVQKRKIPESRKNLLVKTSCEYQKTRKRLTDEMFDSIYI